MLRPFFQSKRTRVREGVHRRETGAEQAKAGGGRAATSAPGQGGRDVGGDGGTGRGQTGGPLEEW